MEWYGINLMSAAAMDLSALRAPRPVPPKLSAGDQKVQGFLRDLEKIKTSKRPRKQLKRSEDLIHRIVQALRRTDEDHLLYTTSIWVLINVFRMFPEEVKEIMIEVGVPGVLHGVIASGILNGAMRQYTSELCFFLSSNQPYPDAKSIPATGPLTKMPEVATASRYNGDMDDISIASSDISSVVPEGHHAHSKYNFVPYRINDQNLQKIDALFSEGYEKQMLAALPNPEFMSRFGFVGANARRVPGVGGDGTGTGITGEDWKLSDSDDEDEEEQADLRNHDDGSVNSTISSGSRSLAYSKSRASHSVAGSVQSGRYSFSSGISGVGLPITASESHGVGIGIHNRQIGKYAGGIEHGKVGFAPTLTTVGMKEYDSWHERHAPGVNPFSEDASPLYTHYRPTSTNAERARAATFRIGGFGVGPHPTREVAAASTMPVLGADLPRRGSPNNLINLNEGLESLDLHSQSMSLSLSHLSHEPKFNDMNEMSRSLEFHPDAVQDRAHRREASTAHHRSRHHHAIQAAQHLVRRSHSHGDTLGHKGNSLKDLSEQLSPEKLNSPFYAPLRSIASSQYGDRPADLLQEARNPFAPSTSLLELSSVGLVSPTHHTRTQTAGSPSRVYPTLTGAVHPPRRDRDHHSAGHPSTAPSPHSHSHSPNRRSGSSVLKRDALGGTSRSEIDDMLAQLDPLSLSLNNLRTTTRAKEKRLNTVGRRGHDLEENSQTSWRTDNIDNEDGGGEEDEENEFDDEDSSQTSQADAGFFESHLVEAPGSRFNEFLARKRMRIRAEKLVDHNFTKKLFVKKATTTQAQNLIARMESLLQLMDPTGTGFVTWECFARLILAVAPTHLLRSDVMAFMKAQTDSDQDLIDYKEFIISGKVMVIEKQKTRKDNLPVTGWLNRQKLYSGEESTHTWQNHIKWYQSRKSKAVVWLMRRATRSMKYSVLLAEADKFLMNQRKRALAVTYLLEVGYVAVNSQGVWKEAQRVLLKRSMHARRTAMAREAAQKWLAALSAGVLEQMRLEEETNQSLAEASIASSMESLLNPPKKKQADYANFYKLHQYNYMAWTYLTGTAQKTIKHCARQDEVQLSLATYGRRMLMHQLYTESARNWLKMSGERAYQYCMLRDDTMKNLFRRGQHALAYMIRQEEALAWLLNRGVEAVAFVESKAESLEFLIRKGQHTLHYLNAREEAFASLVVRKNKAVRLLVRQKEAILFLAKAPQGLWNTQEKIKNTQIWLAARGQRAKEHLERRAKAAKALQYTAGKASTVMRKQNIAYTDLQQFGQEAKIGRFTAQCKTVPQYARRVKEEKQRILQADSKRNKERASMHKQQRWKAELLDAFEWMATCITPPVYQGGKKALIGRIGFLKLMINGKLLGTTKDITYDFFKAVDPNTSCFVPFDNVWTWFLYHAESYEKLRFTPRDKVFTFTFADIVSAEERAIVTTLKRVNSEKVEFNYDPEWDTLEEKRRRAAEEASSSEEEEEDPEEIDDDTLFDDPRFMNTADVGRLMKYLTKRQQQREREAKAEAYAAEQKALEEAERRVLRSAKRNAGAQAYSPTTPTKDVAESTGASASEKAAAQPGETPGTAGHSEGVEQAGTDETLPKGKAVAFNIPDNT